MFITDPRFLILILSHPDPGSRISDPGFNKVKGEDNFCLTFLVSHKFHKVENYFSTFYPKFYPILVLFTQNIATMLSDGLGILDSRSGIQKKPIPDPGIKQHWITDPQYWDLDN
jgi:hypothetical protein